MEYDELIEDATLKADLKIYDEEYDYVFLVDENINIRVEVYDETTDDYDGKKQLSFEFSDINEAINDIIENAEINKRKVSEQALEKWIERLLEDAEFDGNGDCRIVAEIPEWEVEEEE